ncbi:MAG: tyrosine-type recombinase/integrase [Solibacillus sp.]
MYCVKEALLVKSDGHKSCYFILFDGLPLFEVNRWLEYKGMNSSLTSKKYAFALMKFFTYLHDKNKSYKDVTKRDIVLFIDYLLFNNDSENILSFESSISYQTASGYLTVIKEFYRYLEDVTNDGLNLMYSTDKKRTASHSYLYGQVWDMDIKELLVHKLPRIKSTKEHLKWYTEEDKQAILSNFNSLRDKALFALTLEGMRISEVINLDMTDYLSNEGIISIPKSKNGKARIVPLQETTIELIENYLYNERSIVEGALGFLDALFINLKEGKSYGKRISYRNSLNLIKTAAEKAGFNPEGIRTHSGRSTRTMELLKYQSEHPEDNLTDEQIRLMMGWSSSKSLEPYMNYRDESVLVALAKKTTKKKGEDSE